MQRDDFVGWLAEKIGAEMKKRLKPREFQPGDVVVTCSLAKFEPDGERETYLDATSGQFKITLSLYQPGAMMLVLGVNEGSRVRVLALESGRTGWVSSASLALRK